MDHAANNLTDEQRRRNQKDDWHYKFTNHTPSEEGIRKIESLRSVAKAHADAIIDICPPGREQSLALTHLEETSTAAIAAVARHFTLDNPVYAQEQSAAEDGPKTEQKS